MAKMPSENKMYSKSGSNSTDDDFKIYSRRSRAFSFMKEKHMDLLAEDEGIRPRTCSMPTRSEIKKPNLHHISRRHHGNLSYTNEHENGIGTYPVRMFEVNSKGVIQKRADSMRSCSTTSISSESELCGHHSRSSLASSSSQDSVGTCKSGGHVATSVVKVLGGDGVGKTAIAQQFMTSEYLGGFDTSMGM